MPPRSSWLEAMVHAAVHAGESIEAALGRRGALSVIEKGVSDYVSTADLDAQAIVQRELGDAFPDHALLLEEGAHAPREPGRPRFIVDPLDGTTNFLHGIPHFAVSIAREVDGEIVAGTIVDPMRREVFWAEKGEGAWLGDRRIAVSTETSLARAVVTTGIPHRGLRDHEGYLQALARVMREVSGIRRFGAAALDLAYVAAGRCDAFFERGLAPWDVAAGALIVREAGGVVTRPDGAVEHLSGDILATSSEAMHRAMLELIAPLAIKRST